MLESLDYFDGPKKLKESSKRNFKIEMTISLSSDLDEATLEIFIKDLIKDSDLEGEVLKINCSEI